MAGQKDKCKKRRRTNKTSKGLSRMQRARQVLRKILQKIKRWEKNQQNPNKRSQWDKEQKPHLRSRHNGWDITGLKKHAELLQEIIKRGKTRKK